MPNLKKRIVKVCPICKKEFETGGRAGRKDKIFCGWDCSRLARYRHGSQCNKLNKIDCAYIAGFIDGEGSIMIIKRGNLVDSYGIRTTIAQSEKGVFVLEWIKEITGIGSIVNKPRFNPLHANNCFWQVNSDAAETLLLQILPYLKLKKEQAEMALDFQNKLRQPELKADRSWQIDFRKGMQLLNLRGLTISAEA